MKYKLAFLVLAAALFGFVGPRSEWTNDKIWILFKDRPYLKSQSLKPTQMTSFTKESIRRRELRAIVPWDESDFPVDRAYVDDVRRAGATVFVESRWLNGVSASCNSSCRAKIKTLSYVSEILPVLKYRRPAESVTEVHDSGATIAAPEELMLTYGNSKQQLEQLKVPFAHNKGWAGQGEIVAMFDAGFRKDHIAFKNAVIVGEQDFVFKQPFVSNTDSHGTSTWSALGGAAPGKLYGPAYKASFILATTEDVRSETRVEEDNWVAALEWADRLGATVVSSSLGYFDWYQQSDFNGSIPVTSRVASNATKKGIVVVNSAGNGGPGTQTLGAPADARNILTVGAITSTGDIAGFSSRGPTADGRIKPEVVARGVFNWLAIGSTPNSFGRGNGTSFSCPLIGGSAAVLLSAHPEWTPIQVREALMQSANNKDTPNNDYGWGLPNLQLALEYIPVNGITIDHVPLKNTANTTQPYNVQARIRAYRGLNTNELYLFWKVSTAAAFTRVKLTPVPGAADRFQASIPAQPHGTTLLYYMTAKDTVGKLFKSPRRAPADRHIFIIL